MEHVVWFDGHGNERHSLVLAKHTHNVCNMPASWVAVWDERASEPRWISLHDCERFYCA